MQKQELFIGRLVYNLTDQPITCYDTGGSFMELLPLADKTLPDFKYGISYIVPEEVYETVKRTDRTTSDLVHVITDKPQEGRGHVKFYYLETYDSMSSPNRTRIAPYPPDTYLRHGVSSGTYRAIED